MLLLLFFFLLFSTSGVSKPNKNSPRPMCVVIMIFVTRVSQNEKHMRPGEGLLGDKKDCGQWDSTIPRHQGYHASRQTWCRFEMAKQVGLLKCVPARHTRGIPRQVTCSTKIPTHTHTQEQKREQKGTAGRVDLSIIILGLPCKGSANAMEHMRRKCLGNLPRLVAIYGKRGG